MVFEPGFERLGVHGAVVGLGRDGASQAQAADEGDRLVMAMRNSATQAFAAPSSAVPTRHVGRRPRLVDEHPFQRIEVELAVEPSPPPFKDVRAVLFAGVRRLLWNGPPLLRRRKVAGGSKGGMGMDIAVLGVDLGKNVCSVVGLDASGAVVMRRKVRRETLVALAEKLCSMRCRDGGLLRRPSSRSGVRRSRP